MGVSDSMSLMISRMDLSWSSVSSNSKIFSNSDPQGPSGLKAMPRTDFLRA